MNLSLAMITKNEEFFLPLCLKNVEGLVDEIVVVDTGSTDHTIEIAKAAGALVHTTEWENDFSAPRNISLSLCAGDWILILDPDEVIAEQDHEMLRSLLSNPSNAYAFTTRNYVNNPCIDGYVPNDGSYPRHETGSGWFPSFKTRLFPNNKGVKFEREMHELVDMSAQRQGLTITPSSIPIHHYGKMNKDDARRKNELYYSMSLWNMANTLEPDNLKNIAIAATEAEKFGEAFTFWQHYTKKCPADPQGWFNFGHVFYRLGKWDDCINASKNTLHLDPSHKGAKINIALAQLAKSRCR